MVSGQWSVVSGSVVGCRWSVVSGQLSVVSGQLSVVKLTISSRGVAIINSPLILTRFQPGVHVIRISETVSTVFRRIDF
jgi:hypothetical protein